MGLVYSRAGVDVWSPSGSTVLPISASGNHKPHVLLEGEEYKHCSGCGTWRPLGCFNFFARSCDKLQSWCTSCFAASIASRRKAKIIR